jgi:hypothetical protein
MKGTIHLPSWPSGKPATTPAERVREYRALLKTHDWSYEYSDDPTVYERGRNERTRLRILQRELDTTLAIWNELAPADYRIVTRLAEVQHG